MTSEMDRSARAIARTQALVLEQQFYLSRQRPPVFSGDGNPTRTDRLRKAADMGTDDHAAAGDPFNRNKTKSFHAPGPARHDLISGDKSSRLARALNSSESHLLFTRELPDSRHN